MVEKPRVVVDSVVKEGGVDAMGEQVCFSLCGDESVVEGEGCDDGEEENGGDARWRKPRWSRGS